MKVRSSKCYGFRPPTVKMPSSLVLALGTYVVGWLLRFVYLYDSYIGTVMLYMHIYLYVLCLRLRFSITNHRQEQVTT